MYTHDNIKVQNYIVFFVIWLRSKQEKQARYWLNASPPPVTMARHQDNTRQMCRVYWTKALIIMVIWIWTPPYIRNKQSYTIPVQCWSTVYSSGPAPDQHGKIREACRSFVFSHTYCQSKVEKRLRLSCTLFRRVAQKMCSNILKLLGQISTHHMKPHTKYILCTDTNMSIWL